MLHNAVTMQMTRLQRLVCCHNNLGRLPDDLACANTLLYIDISNNKIAEIEALANMKAVRVFRASGNRLRTLPHTFKSWHNLLELDLSSNVLQVRATASRQWVCMCVRVCLCETSVWGLICRLWMTTCSLAHFPFKSSS